MNWTPTPLAELGFYAWKLLESDKDDEVSPLIVDKLDDGELCAWGLSIECEVAKLGGLWCRLVPVVDMDAAVDMACGKLADDYVVLQKRLAVEVEKAWREGWYAACDASSQVLSVQEAHWDHSRAKRVANGEEA